MTKKLPHVSCAWLRRLRTKWIKSNRHQQKRWDLVFHTLIVLTTAGLVNYFDIDTPSLEVNSYATAVVTGVSAFNVGVGLSLILYYLGVTVFRIPEKRLASILDFFWIIVGVSSLAIAGQKIYTTELSQDLEATESRILSDYRAMSSFVTALQSDCDLHSRYAGTSDIDQFHKVLCANYLLVLSNNLNVLNNHVNSLTLNIKLNITDVAKHQSNDSLEPSNAKPNSLDYSTTNTFCNSKLG